MSKTFANFQDLTLDDDDERSMENPKASRQTKQQKREKFQDSHFQQHFNEPSDLHNRFTKEFSNGQPQSISILQEAFGMPIKYPYDIPKCLSIVGKNYSKTPTIMHYLAYWQEKSEECIDLDEKNIIKPIHKPRIAITGGIERFDYGFWDIFMNEPTLTKEQLILFLKILRNCKKTSYIAITDPLHLTFQQFFNEVLLSGFEIQVVSRPHIRNLTYIWESKNLLIKDAFQNSDLRKLMDYANFVFDFDMEGENDYEKTHPYIEVNLKNVTIKVQFKRKSTAASNGYVRTTITLKHLNMINKDSLGQWLAGFMTFCFNEGMRYKHTLEYEETMDIILKTIPKDDIVAQLLLHELRLMELLLYTNRN